MAVQEQSDGDHGFVNCCLVVDGFVFGGCAESNSSRKFKIYQVGTLVPGIGIEADFLGAGSDEEGPVLLKHADEAGAAGSSSEPQNDWIFGVVLLRFEIDVVDGLEVDCDADIEIACVRGELPE